MFFQPPKWQRTGNCGVSFAFGAKLVRFGRPENEAELLTQQMPVPRSVEVQLMTAKEDATLVELTTKAEALKTALTSGLFCALSHSLTWRIIIGANALIDYCEARASQSQNEADRLWWRTMQVCAGGSRRTAYKELLSDNGEFCWISVGKLNFYFADSQWAEILAQLNATLGNDKCQWRLGSIVNDEDEDSLQNSARLDSNQSVFNDSAASCNIVEELAAIRQPLTVPTNPTDVNSQLCATIADSNINSAVELCIRNDRWADAILLASSADEQVYARTVKLYAQVKQQRTFLH